MFGHQNNDEDSTQPTTNPALPGSFPVVAPASNGDNQPLNPALPSSDSSWTDKISTEAPASVTPDAAAPSDEAPAMVATSSQSNVTDDLLDIKQQALSQLSPLVSHLEQTPEEKFRTTMMMIQATDNQALVKDAYAAAQEISDEKAKAQALLDIVNEINYFTQHHQG